MLLTAKVGIHSQLSRPQAQSLVQIARLNFQMLPYDFRVLTPNKCCLMLARFQRQVTVCSQLRFIVAGRQA